MAKYRKLSRTSNQRKALLRNQVTNLLHHGKIVTTEAKAKEIRKIAEGLIAMAVREKDNFETVTVTAKVARKDADGKRVKEVVDGKKKTVYDEVQKEIKKDAPSRLHARRQMMKVFYPVKEVPAKGAGRKKNTKEVDMVDKMFEEIAPKYADVTVVTQESLRSDSVKAMQQWKFLSSLYNLLLTDLKDICRNADVLF